MPRPRPPQHKLFVGGLAFATRDGGLRAAFEVFGEVLDARVIMDRCARAGAPVLAALR